MSRQSLFLIIISFVGFVSIPGCVVEDGSTDGESPRQFPAADGGPDAEGGGSEEGEPSVRPFDAGEETPPDAGVSDAGGADVGTAETGTPGGGSGEPDTGMSSGDDSGAGCSSGETKCGGTCVDLSSNSDHCGSCGRSCAGGGSCTDGYCAPDKESAALIARTNDVRSSQTDCGSEGTFSSAPPVEGNTHLHEAAQRHADDMVANSFFSHTGSDGSQFQDRIRDTAFAGRPLAENIAAGNNSAERTVQQWKGSDGHCRNMMKSQATHMGVGIAMGGEYGMYWVQVFGVK